MAKQGEENMGQIWPSDGSQILGFNEKARNMDTGDINQNKYNPRMQKLREADAVRARAQMQSVNSHHSSSQGPRPDRNVSNVFGHLVDDPTTRAKRQAAPMPPQQQYAQIQMDNPGQAYGDQDIMDR